MEKQRFDEDELLTAREAAKFIKVSRPVLYDLNKRFNLAFGRLGRGYRFRARDLLEKIKNAN